MPLRSHPTYDPLVGNIVRVTLKDGRDITGMLMASDSHANVVMNDAVESRQRPDGIDKETKKKKIRTETRELGLVMLRGEEVIHIAVEGHNPSGHSVFIQKKQERSLNPQSTQGRMEGTTNNPNNTSITSGRKITGITDPSIKNDEPLIF